MQRGTIRFYNEKEAYGFIDRDQPGRDVFIHLRSVKEGIPAVGATVEFEIEYGERGPRAGSVIVYD